MTVCGIPIRINTSWGFIAVFMAWSRGRGYFPEDLPGFAPLVYWLMGAAAALLLFVCVLLHELGHALIARRCGIPVVGITLFMFGGVAQLGSDPKRPRVELMVALAGPLVSAAIAGICFFVSSRVAAHGAFQIVGIAIVRYLAMINLGLLLFNLLPGFPLDGGRLLRAALWAWSGNLQRATRIASAIGGGFGVGLLLLGVWAILRGGWATGMWYVLLGFFLRNAALSSYRHASR